MTLDYTLNTAKERTEYVKSIINSLPEEELTEQYITILSNYILSVKEKGKKKKFLTDNRLVTINKREISFQGMAENLDSGEDGIYNLITNDKNILFTPKISITKKDLEEIPELRNLKKEIEKTEEKFKKASGKDKYNLKKQLIEMRQDQYVIKNSYRKPITFMNIRKSFSKIDFNENIKIENGEIKSDGIISLFNPLHVRCLLNNYSILKEESYGKFWTDSYYIISDLENLIDSAIKNKYPILFDLLVYKIDGKSNEEISCLLNQKYKIKYSVEHISFLWTKKIPKIITEKAESDYIDWWFTEKEKGVWKKCSKCGKIKLANKKYYTKNGKGFYSICKECRNSDK